MINEKPLYFYHLVDKKADLSKGLLSLQYMYDHHMDDLFNKYAEKYHKRITSSWQIEKYQGKKSLTKKEYLDALNIFHGKYGSSYIYFFRFAPYKELGPHMAQILETKDIYRIDINKIEVQKHIKHIFYGYEKSHSDNKILTKSYYENITFSKYFEDYDDSSQMLFAPLNHIAIAFKDDYCPISLLEKL